MATLDVLIRARDQASATIRGVGTSASAMGKEVQAVSARTATAGTAVRGWAKSLGGFFGVLAGAAFIKRSLDAFDQLEKQSKTLQVGLDKIHQPRAFTDISNWASDFADQTGILEADLITMAARLTNMGQAFFNAVGPESAHWLEVMTTDLEDMAAATGKSVGMLMRSLGPSILNQPEKAVTLLTKLGVLTDQQAASIVKLSAAGDREAATEAILNSIHEKFGGTAAKTATAYDKLAERINKVEVFAGSLVSQALRPMIPVLDVVGQNAAGLLAAFIAYKSVSFIPALIAKISLAMHGGAAAAGAHAIALEADTLAAEAAALRQAALVAPTEASATASLTDAAAKEAEAAALLAEATAAGTAATATRGLTLATLGIAAVVGIAAQGLIQMGQDAANNRRAVEDLAQAFLDGKRNYERMVASVRNSPGIPEWAKPRLIDLYTQARDKANIADAASRHGLLSLGNILDFAGRKTGGLVSGLGDLAGADHEAARAAIAHRNAVRALWLAEQELAGGILGVISATVDDRSAQNTLAQAQDRVAKLRAAGKEGTDKYRQALGDERAAALAATQAHVGLAGAVTQLEDDVRSGKVSLADGIDTLRAFGKDAGLTGRDIQGMVQKLRDAKSGIDALHDKVITITTHFLITGEEAAVRAAHGQRAAGGPVLAGMPYEINEPGSGGGEIFVPDVPGRVAPHYAMSTVLGGSGADLSPRAPVMHFHFGNIHIGGVRDGRQAADQLVRHLAPTMERELRRLQVVRGQTR